MKRRRADRQAWSRIKRRRFAAQFIESEAYTGHVTLLCLDAVREPLWVTVAGRPVCVVFRPRLQKRRIFDRLQGLY